MQQRLIVRGILRDVEGRIFTARRACTKRFFPDIYELPGRWVEFGEQFSDALCREFYEECGVKITVGAIARVGTALLEDMHLAEVFYFVELLNPDWSLTIKPEDHSEMRWWTQAEFEREWESNHPDFQAMQKAFAIISR